MLAILLSLCSAVAYGLSDFVGGIVTRRASVWAVAVASQATAAVFVISLVATNLGHPRFVHGLWGALAGLGSGVGSVLLYRALARGRMAVVAPLSAITAAAVPLLVGLSIGERPGTLPMIGVLIAFPAVWLISISTDRSGNADRRDVAGGLLAGLGFGILFSALGQVPEEAGFGPLAVSQAVSVLVIVTGAIAKSAPWIPRDRYSRFGAVAGLLAGGATVCFQLAAQRGQLAIAGVVASLYPAVTVLLAFTVLHESIGRAQRVGLGLAMTSIILAASG